MNSITNISCCPVCGGRMLHGGGICFTCGYMEFRLDAPAKHRRATKSKGQRKLKYGYK